MIEINGQQYELPCAIPDLPEQLYHAHWAVGSSGIRDYLVSPATHRYGGQSFDRDAAAIGTALHLIIGDTEAFNECVATDPVKPDGSEYSRNSNYFKDERARWIEHTGGLGLMLKRSQYELVHKMEDAIWRYEWLPPEMSDGPLRVEWSIFWRDPRTGIVCKCRPDLWYHSRQAIERLVIDLKTSHTDVSPQAWGKISAGHGYHIQDAFYRRGLQAWYSYLTDRQYDFGLEGDRFKFLVVGKQPVPPVGMYYHTAYQLERGEKAIDEALAGIRWCREKDRWPGDFEPAATVQPQWQSYEHDCTMSRARNYRRRVAPESFPQHEMEEMNNE